MSSQSRPKGVWGTLVYLSTRPGWGIVIAIAFNGLGVLGVYVYNYLYG
jgi:hypothetical protein